LTFPRVPLLNDTFVKYIWLMIFVIRTILIIFLNLYEIVKWCIIWDIKSITIKVDITTPSIQLWNINFWAIHNIIKDCKGYGYIYTTKVLFCFNIKSKYIKKIINIMASKSIMPSHKIDPWSIYLIAGSMLLSLETNCMWDPTSSIQIAAKYELDCGVAIYCCKVVRGLIVTPYKLLWWGIIYS
jgi:hypothetical protein